MTTAPPELTRIKATFDATYAPVGGMTLPLEALLSRSDGEIVEQGWVILYQFGREDSSDYLDVYDTHRMTDDSHWRIHATGVTEALEQDRSAAGLIQQKWGKQLQRALETARQRLNTELDYGA
jgi:hypothetical protein